MPPTKKTPQKNAPAQSTPKMSPGAQSAQSTASNTATPILSGDVVHYHAENDSKPTQDSAMPATVLRVADKKSMRVDLLVLDGQGKATTRHDVEHSAERKAGNWSQRSA